MIKVGLTGGIGTGKSVVASILESLGVPVFHADQEARNILNRQEVITKVSGSFGSRIINSQGLIDRKELAGLVFADPAMLGKLNDIVHPLVAEAFDDFCLGMRERKYVVHEAAILYESGFDKYFDKIIVVTAPLEVCIERVMNRDRVSREEVLMRMQNQWEPHSKSALADYIIQNDDNSPVLPQVLKLHELFNGIVE